MFEAYMEKCELVEKTASTGIKCIYVYNHTNCKTNRI